MKYFLLCLVLFFAPVSAQAQEVLSNEQKSIIVDPDICRTLVHHTPDDDVAYQPGVDVDGDPVVGADLNDTAFQAPNEYSFDITVDVSEYQNMAQPDGIEGQLRIGRITYENGRLLMDGEPLSDAEKEAVYYSCHHTNPPADGQAGSEGDQAIPENAPSAD